MQVWSLTLPLLLLRITLDSALLWKKHTLCNWYDPWLGPITTRKKGKVKVQFLLENTIEHLVGWATFLIERFFGYHMTSIYMYYKCWTWHLHNICDGIPQAHLSLFLVHAVYGKIQARKYKHNIQFKVTIILQQIVESVTTRFSKFCTKEVI